MLFVSPENAIPIPRPDATASARLLQSSSSSFAHAATVTVQVGSGGNRFNPATQNIHTGDTVQWTWVASNHSTTSGTPGNPNGTWDSGIHNSGFTFSSRIHDGGKLRLLLQGPRSNDDGHHYCCGSNTNTYSDGHTNSDTDAHANTDADANAHTDSNADTFLVTSFALPAHGHRCERADQHRRSVRVDPGWTMHLHVDLRRNISRSHVSQTYRADAHSVTFTNNLPALAGAMTVHHHGNHSVSADDGQATGASFLFGPGHRGPTPMKGSRMARMSAARCSSITTTAWARPV